MLLLGCINVNPRPFGKQGDLTKRSEVVCIDARSPRAYGDQDGS